MKQLIGLVMVGLLAACAAPQSPQEVVFEAKAGHAAALRAAVVYRGLPACPAAAPCKDPTIVAQLQKADKVADAALDAAENVVRTPGFGKNVQESAIRAALEALNAFTSIIAMLKGGS